MTKDDLIAHTQYSDLVGTSSIDGHMGPELDKLAKEYGIDTNRYFPIGVELSLVEGYHAVSILAVDGVQSSIEFAECFIDIASPLRITSFELVGLTVHDYLKRVKRFNAYAINRNLVKHTEFDVDYEEAQKLP